MPIPSSSTARLHTQKRLIGFLLVLIGGLACLTHQYGNRNKNTGDLGRDFRAVYGSSRCLIAGCNPYFFQDARAQFLRQGGSLQEAESPASGAFQPFYVGYPPPTLFYLVPFTLLRWPLAWFVYLGISIALYAVAALLYSDLCSEYAPIAANLCLALFLAAQGVIVRLAQPTLLAAALLGIAVWCLVKHRYLRLGVVSFALSLLFKPPLGGLILLYFLVASPNHRKRALQVLGLTIALCLPALLWFSTHAADRNWMQDYRTNLTGIAAPGNLSDPGPRHLGEKQIIDLQTIVSLYRDEPAFYNRAVWAFSALVLALWLYPAIRRRPSQEKDLLCIAAIAAFSMLPVYHRTYDSRALLILFPALALLLRRTRGWGRAAAGLTVVLALFLSDFYIGHFNPTGRFAERIAGNRGLAIAILHPVPLILLIVTIFYLAVLYVAPPSLGLEADPAQKEIAVLPSS